MTSYKKNYNDIFSYLIVANNSFNRLGFEVKYILLIASSLNKITINYYSR